MNYDDNPLIIHIYGHIKGVNPDSTLKNERSPSQMAWRRFGLYNFFHTSSSTHQNLWTDLNV